MTRDAYSTPSEIRRLLERLDNGPADSATIAAAARVIRNFANRPRHSGIGDRPAVAQPIRGDGTDCHGRVGIDARRVTRDQALEFMCHHLALAVTYYEATPHDQAEVTAETERLLSSEIDGYAPPELIAARGFLAAMNAHYESLKENDDAE